MILDFYDDPQGTVLKSKIPTHNAVPDFIKTAEHLGDRFDSLPDDVFALVMVDQGVKMRKYACVDKGNTALSVLYFIENHDRLPENAVKVAAVNLLAACEVHDIVPPLPLCELADDGYEKVAFDRVNFDRVNIDSPKIDTFGDKLFKAVKKAKGKGKLIAAGAAGLAALGGGAALLARRRAKAKKDKEKTAGLGGLAKGLMGAGLAGGEISAGADRHNKMMSGVKRGIPAGQVKVSDVVGTEIMPQSVDKEMREKTASPYVDVTGQKPKVKIARVKYERYCLVKEGSSKFPIDSYPQVHQAIDWFDEYHESLHPEDRREYCIKLAARADELHIPITDQIEKYAAATVAPDGQLKIAFGTRRQFWREGDSELSLLDQLEAEGRKAGIEKSAEAAEIVCEALRQFDEATGLHHHWDSEVYDPYYSIFGQEKTAEWKFDTHGDRITEKELRQLTQSNLDKLTQKFGSEIAEGLRKNPTQIFDSLPLDSKRIIMRMAADPQPDPALVSA